MLHFFALSKPPERGCQSFCSHQALSHSEPCAVQPHMQNTLPGHLHCALPSVQLQSRLHLCWVTSLINPTARTKHSHPSATLLVTTGGIYPARKAGREKEGKLHLIYPTGSEKRTFTDIALAQQTAWKHFQLPRYVLAKEGGYQGTATYCHANAPSY